ncbi:MAG: hypothetical protein FWF59_01735 [Turicibacter sp.]|nr:hypothetical protein [Turicibacter sp.]
MKKWKKVFCAVGIAVLTAAATSHQGVEASSEENLNPSAETLGYMDFQPFSASATFILESAYGGRRRSVGHFSWDRPFRAQVWLLHPGTHLGQPSVIHGSTATANDVRTLHGPWVSHPGAFASGSMTSR